MSQDWQNAIVLGVVAVAALYLVVRAGLMLFRRKSAGCGSGCGSCPSNAASSTKSPVLVSIDAGPAQNGRKL
jgi:hypothetical protein